MECIAVLVASLTAACIREVLVMKPLVFGAGDGERLLAEIVLRLGCYAFWRSLVAGFLNLVSPMRTRAHSGDLYGSVVAEMEVERGRRLNRPV